MVLRQHTVEVVVFGWQWYSLIVSLDIEPVRLRSSLDQICQLQTRANQRPGRNRATVILALHTGLPLG
jgi:hypothetical protein